MSRQIPLKRPQDTINLAKSVTPFVKLGTVILLSGDLGSGKTFFTSHLCSFLGVQDTVNSPSFVLLKQYQAEQFPVFHIDLYRLKSVEEVLSLGIREFCETGVTIIEWPHLIEHIFTDDVIRINFRFEKGSRSAEVIPDIIPNNAVDFPERRFQTAGPPDLSGN